MQTANILLRLANDEGNSVPLFNVTPAEIAVLRVIHGDDAVRDVEPTGAINRPNNAERLRLQARYGRPQEDGRPNPVNFLFPGAAARVFETLDELMLPEEFYKAERRMTSGSRNGQQPTMVEEVVAMAAEDEETDGVEDINDKVSILG